LARFFLGFFIFLAGLFFYAGFSYYYANKCPGLFDFLLSLFLRILLGLFIPLALYGIISLSYDIGWCFI